MDRFFNLPLEIWVNKIFPLLNPHDFLSLISTNKNNYKYITNGFLEVNETQATWNLFFYKEIGEIKHYMNDSYDSMMGYFDFAVSAAEWEVIVTETIYRKLQIPNANMKQDQTSLLEKLKDFKHKIILSTLKERWDLGNFQLLYDSFCVFLSFKDRAFYPVKYECDNVMLSSAEAIKVRDDFEFGSVAKTLGQLVECFKILVSVYEQDNMYFKQRMRYTSNQQCLSFYRCIMNYCSPFESLGSLKNTNSTLFSIYLLTFIEKILSLIYENTFQKVTNLLVFKNSHGNFTFKLNCKINNVIYEILVDELAWSIKEVAFVEKRPEDSNFLTTCLLDKVLFNSFVQTASGLGEQAVSKSPNMHFTEFKNYPDLDFDRLKLYYHYTKYGYYTSERSNNVGHHVVEDKITLIEKKKHKMKANGLRQKFWLINSRNEDTCFLFSTEVGAINEFIKLSKNLVKRDYIICDAQSHGRDEKTNAILENSEKFSDSLTFTQYFMLYLIYGCGFVSSLHNINDSY